MKWDIELESDIETRRGQHRAGALNILLKSSEFGLKIDTATAYDACCGVGGSEVAAAVSAVAMA